ncbi:MAG TPA: HAMP domain-containing sensor histidine kinase [Acidimicrobiales bacterium]|jgi:signal transduction histidine kinase|nr:HAMP domain-containing sensor histidine kinase [Acidimicrobiales bacterium]
MTTGGEDDAAARRATTAVDVERALADVDAIRRRVVNVVGHALRTPVTTMAGMAAALATTTDEATRATLVDGLVRNAGRVERLLDDLLVAVGVTTALPIDDAEATPVHATLAVAWDSVGGTGPLAVDGPEMLAHVQPSAFARLAELLLDNALKYGHGVVRITTERTQLGVRIEFESAGDGPTDEEVEKAFELLYRGEHAVMTAPGLGVGLAVARELAQANGGAVSFDRRGSWVVTTVDLPAA